MKKVITSITICATMIANGYSQISQIWNQSYQHTTSIGFSNESRKVAEDPSGNIFTLCDATSDLSPQGTVTGTTYHYSVVTKYSSNGIQLAQQVIEVFGHQTSGFNNPGAFGLETDAAGNVYVGFGKWDGTFGTHYNVEVRKYNNSLSQIWTCLYAGNGDDYGVEMKVASSGEVYSIIRSVAGAVTTYSLYNFFQQGAPSLIYSFPTSCAINAMALDPVTERVYVTGYKKPGTVKTFYLASINTTTHFLTWDYNNNFGSATFHDYGTAITIGVDGNIYATGAIESSSGNNILVVKHPPSPAKMSWISTSRFQATDYPKFILAPESNYAYLGVQSLQNVTLYKFNTLSSPSMASPCVYRPTQPNSTASAVTLNAMKVSANQKIYITGAVSLEDQNGFPYTASFLAKFNVVLGTTVSLASARPVTGDINESFEGVGISLDVTKTDVYWLVSSTDNISNPKSEKVRLYDMDVPAPLREASETARELNVSVFPNPASDQITITAGEAISSIEISDITGKIIKSMNSNLTETKTEISLAGFKKGLYIIKVVSESGDVTINKFVVQ
jgi:hypothetical protein